MEYRLLVLVLQEPMDDEWQLWVTVGDHGLWHIFDDDRDSCAGLRGQSAKAQSR